MNFNKLFFVLMAVNLTIFSASNAIKLIETKESPMKRIVDPSFDRIDQTFKGKIEKHGYNMMERAKKNADSPAINALQERSGLCGTTASVKCGDELLKLTKNHEVVNIHKRCQTRQEFLNCIEIERKKCMEFTNQNYFPLLPSKSQVKLIQETAWKTLWTSGGCVLAP